MKTVLSAVAAAVLVAAATPAAADWIDDRQARQMLRIEEGLRSGQLTREEYRRLVDQQREIARLERVLERDGHLSYSDRIRLNALQDAASRSIFWEKHDGQTRNSGGWNGWGGGWGNGRGNAWGNDRGNDWGRGNHRDYRGDGWGPRADRNSWHRRWWAWN